MPAIEIKPDIYWIGVNDRTTDLFEGIWPITESGVSYNSYLIRDEKTAIIDLAKSSVGDSYLSQIEDVTPLSAIDYIVVNHMEPDHSGLIRTLRRLAPQVTILGSEKTRKFLEDFFDIRDNVRVVKDGETISLGRRSLRFFSTPFLHWPETIMTFEESEGVLFSCDAFGGYGALRGDVFDDECHDLGYYEKEALRYYVNIVANFSARVLSALEKLKDVPLSVIAPSHGLIWRRHPERIIELYKRWAEYASGPSEKGITLVYASMYGNTELMMNAVARGIARAGVPVEIFDAARTHVSYILSSLWVNQGVAVGAPTYEVSLFPPMAEVLRMAAHKRITGKTAAYFGSFGWCGGALKGMKALVEPLKWNMAATMEFMGSPSLEELQRGEELGAEFAERIRTS